ncbi:MAG: DNA-formamidopyrimidine glycosylase family protein [Candidatus Hodarchaeales archaeon]|jgi:formamidopyrimidine-DNA glycosylase
MPELPELEGISNYLSKKLSGEIITEVETFIHTVIRIPGIEQFKSMLEGAKLENVKRKGKLLIFYIRSGEKTLALFLDHGLTGRLSWEKKKLPAKTVMKIHFKSGKILLYHDRRLHGAIWLYDTTTQNEYSTPSKVRNYGPDILEISLNEFQSRIKRYRGEIKGVLNKQEFVTGIGNAYADEILFDAAIHPFTKRTSLDTSEIEQLFTSCQSILQFSTAKITDWLFSTNQLDNQRFWRGELFRIHLRGEQSCLKCGKAISSIKANRRITNFCRTCQSPRNKNFI